MLRRYFYGGSALALLAIGGLAVVWTPAILWLLLLVLPLVALGIHDCLQTEHTILRNFPILGHGRYLMEMIRPETQQYFIESDIDAHPVEREVRSLVYQRAKNELDTRPFGTQRDVYRVGYEWAGHSIDARAPQGEPPRTEIGGVDCRKPYSASLLNISAMSFGALSHNALLALSRGAQRGGPTELRDDWRAATPERWRHQPESGPYGGEAVRSETPAS